MDGNPWAAQLQGLPQGLRQELWEVPPRQRHRQLWLQGYSLSVPGGRTARAGGEGEGGEEPPPGTTPHSQMVRCLVLRLLRSASLGQTA